MGAWPLTGRVEELGVIADVIAGYGEYAGVAIAGPAGVGKTRLAREAAAAAARRGAQVRWVAGSTAAQSLPLGAFSQWADRLDGHPLQIVGSLVTAIADSPDGAPVLVVVDYAHQLDTLSAFALQQLITRGVARVITTVRTGEPTPEAVTALWKEALLCRLDLQPLSRPESDALLECALNAPVSVQCAERMWQLTHGNVLFLHQLVEQELHAGRLVRADGHWQWRGPMTVSPSLVAVIDLHIGAVAESVVEVVDLVTAAEPLELAYLVDLTDAQTIEDAERLGLISVARAAPTALVRVGHPLYGEARRAQAGQWRMARLRGRIARAMTAPESRLGPPNPLRLATLWLNSDLAPDHGLFSHAAQLAVIRLDLNLALQFAEAAAAAGAGVAAEILCGHVLSLLSRGEESEDLLRRVTAEPLPDVVWVIAVNIRAGNLLWTLGRPEQSWQVIDDALATASAAVRHGLLAFRTIQLAVAARPADAVATAESIDRAQLPMLPTMLLLSALTIALGDLGRLEQATAVAQEGAALAAASPEAASQGVSLALFHTDAMVFGGRVMQAQAVAQRVHREWVDAFGICRTAATANKGIAALAGGDLLAARDCLRTAVIECDLFKDTTGFGYHSKMCHAQTLACAGETHEAEAALARVRLSRNPAAAYLEPSSMLAAAWVAAAGGRTTEATAVANRGADFARAHGQLAREVMCLQAAIQFGDHDQSGRLAELADLVEGPRAPLAARWSAAAGHDGDVLLEVSHGFEAIGDRIAAADAAAHASLAYQQHGLRGAGLTAAGRASSLITECGATTPATRAAASPLKMTGREREIATLVSAGLSNKEIAQSLTVSVRTVEGHIYRACAHLGVAGRAELGDLVAQFPRD